jgi:Sec-independent protein translocase protein TatA
MFGISFLELLIVILSFIILINPKDYPQFFNFLGNIYKDLKKSYGIALAELEKLKEESGFAAESKKLQHDIDNIDTELNQIIGDDGNSYEAYDIKKIMKDHEK